MISVIAFIRVKAGKRAEFLEIFKDNLPRVRAEIGCIEYFPAIDIDANLSSQDLDENIVTIIEKWDSVSALRDHLVAPHMQEYRKKVENIVENISLKVLQEQ